MTTYDNTNRGALFKNDDKQQDNHADYRGNINVGGKEFWLDAYLKTSKAGKKYMSLSVKPKLQSDRASPPTGGKNDPRPAKQEGEEFSDDIPFAIAVAFPVAALLASLVCGLQAYSA